VWDLVVSVPLSDAVHGFIGGDIARALPDYMDGALAYMRCRNVRLFGGRPSGRATAELDAARCFSNPSFSPV
jgi:hypothetical protein